MPQSFIDLRNTKRKNSVQNREWRHQKVAFSSQLYEKLQHAVAYSIVTHSSSNRCQKFMGEKLVYFPRQSHIFPSSEENSCIKNLHSDRTACMGNLKLGVSLGFASINTLLTFSTAIIPVSQMLD